MQEERRIDCEEKEEMLQKIRCHEFTINELALYLDTHPEDRKALCLHKKYCNELKEMKDVYQKVYGPLTIKYPCNKWRWLEMHGLGKRRRLICGLIIKCFNIQLI